MKKHTESPKLDPPMTDPLDILHNGYLSYSVNNTANMVEEKELSLSNMLFRNGVELSDETKEKIKKLINDSETNELSNN